MSALYCSKTSHKHSFFTVAQRRDRKPSSASIFVCHSSLASLQTDQFVLVAKPKPIVNSNEEIRREFCNINNSDILKLLSIDHLILLTPSKATLIRDLSLQIFEKDHILTSKLKQLLEDVRLGYILSQFDLDNTYEWSSVLSVDEQLAFARLLLLRPNLVLLDESTSALDEANEAHLYKLIEAAGITYVSIGHIRTFYEHHKTVLHISRSNQQVSFSTGASSPLLMNLGTNYRSSK
ncbi:hypothetical protein CASFOL_031720 [Castilleja foliolosa]|uniref:ABC transporter domain-containing protein n=1 Tax=Castilleja foliolosa TaxID=1961234 RepID=A0ABD3C6T5_9LAMI